MVEAIDGILEFFFESSVFPTGVVAGVRLRRRLILESRVGQFEKMGFFVPRHARKRFGNRTLIPN